MGSFLALQTESEKIRDTQMHNFVCNLGRTVQTANASKLQV
jgi:hypothetical protein